MITVLSILSSIAVIVYSIITYWQYQLSKKQHHNLLVISQLNKQKDDFIRWFYDYLHMTQLALRHSIQYHMDLLEEAYYADKDLTSDFNSERRQERISENARFYDRCITDIDYQMIRLNFVIDDRYPYLGDAKKSILASHALLEKELNGFSDYIHHDLKEKVRAAESYEAFRELMAEARENARETRARIDACNREMGKGVRDDIHLLEDQILKHVGKKITMKLDN
ncbi:hypothetical protein [Lactococcus termiticola]|uniref:Uncharacterized protein n=1 Tax=Lactococcus termiticola TaxID=2169526 RepID=A0A2R5HJH4_9LACT|nr:hypothetical protein [Lactococcus termiticola]GBG96748.1 hypothetical protein NtB2_00872 [Lactococcus termiticola]